jgi:hypothetical protein
MADGVVSRAGVARARAALARWAARPAALMRPAAGSSSSPAGRAIAERRRLYDRVSRRAAASPAPASYAHARARSAFASLASPAVRRVVRSGPVRRARPAQVSPPVSPAEPAAGRLPPPAGAGGSRRAGIRGGPPPLPGRRRAARPAALRCPSGPWRSALIHRLLAAAPCLCKSWERGIRPPLDTASLLSSRAAWHGSTT